MDSGKSVSELTEFQKEGKCVMLFMAWKIHLILRLDQSINIVIPTVSQHLSGYGELT